MPTKAPTVGEHTEQVLRDVLGWDDAQIAAARRGRRVRHAQAVAPASPYIA